MSAGSSGFKRLTAVLVATSGIVTILIIVWIIHLRDAPEVTFVANGQQITLSYDDPAVQELRSAVGRGGIYSASAGAPDWERAFAAADRNRQHVAMLLPFALATTFATAILTLGLVRGVDERSRTGLILAAIAAVLFGSAGYFGQQPCGFDEYQLCQDELRFLEEQVGVDLAKDESAPKWVEETRGYLATTRLGIGVSLALGLAAFSSGGLLVARGNFRHVIIPGLANLVWSRRA